jgi:tRNA pseudouridine38-40 synthase
MKKKIKITIEYDGHDYAGWQKQPNAASIQQKIEEALFSVFKQKISIHGAGRTDAGVSAFGQVAHFELDSTIEAEKIKFAINTKLAKDIRIIKSEQVDDDFHARYLALGKHYRYIIYNDDVSSAIDRNNTYHVKQPLDIEKMQVAAKHFVGTHDFTAFCAAGSDVDCKVRTIAMMAIRKDDKRIIIDVEGNGFLYNMVRIIVGTLVDVGVGKIAPSNINDIIASKDRKSASATAGASGLCLVKVLY